MSKLHTEGFGKAGARGNLFPSSDRKKTSTDIDQWRKKFNLGFLKRSQTDLRLRPSKPSPPSAIIPNDVGSGTTASSWKPFIAGLTPATLESSSNDNEPL